MASNEKTFSDRFQDVGRAIQNAYVAAALLIFAVGVLVTLISWNSQRALSEKEINDIFQNRTTNVQQAILERMQSSESILRSASALYQVSDTISSQEWSWFVQSSGLEQRYPGTLGVGYGPYITEGQLDQYLNDIRQVQGYDDYAVYPDGTRQAYVPVLLIEPKNRITTQAVGFDMLSEEKRQNAMLAARDTGEITLTDKVELVDLANEESEPGILMYAAVYRTPQLDSLQERRKELRGFVYAVFEVNELLEGVLGESTQNTVGLQLFSTSSLAHENLIFESENYQSLNDASDFIARESVFKVNNQTWSARFVSTKNNFISDQNIREENLILFGGITVSLALTIILYNLMVSRLRDLQLSKQREVQGVKDELIALASHQLRTPATGVKQYVGMALQGYAGKLNKQTREILQKAFASNERQLEIINSLLYVAKADAGQLTLKKGRFNLSQTIKKIIDEMYDEIEQKNMKLKQDIDKDVKYYGDEQLISIVIDNLISNAVKYTPQDGEIRVRLKRLTKNLEIGVSDTGVGIDMEDYDKLFQKFSRIDNELSRSISGSGIGLYLTRKLVLLHGGKITVQSRPGKGSTFTVLLPVKSRRAARKKSTKE